VVLSIILNTKKVDVLLTLPNVVPLKTTGRPVIKFAVVPDTVPYADPVNDPQWFNNPDDENIYVGVLMSSPEELEENKMVVPDGIVQPGSSVVMVYFWP
jgi:hypothetical protein